MKTTYQCRFKLYHYNSGDGRNGIYSHQETFKTAEEAFVLHKKLAGWLAKGDDNPDTNEERRQFASQYCWDGYLYAVDGVYEVTEKQITVPSAT